MLRVCPDGSQRQVEDSPMSSDSSTPVTITVHDNLAFVGNSGAISNYTGFTLDETIQRFTPRAELCLVTCFSTGMAPT